MMQSAQDWCDDDGARSLVTSNRRCRCGSEYSCYSIPDASVSRRMASTVHISAQGDEPITTVKRQEGKYNFGLYCSRCTQFFALAVLDIPGWEVRSSNPTASHFLRAPSATIGSEGKFPRSSKYSECEAKNVDHQSLRHPADIRAWIDPLGGKLISKH
jgi:hypothetical protein